MDCLEWESQLKLQKEINKDREICVLNMNIFKIEAIIVQVF